MDAFAGTILAIAVSIDGLSVGIIYGMKGIRLPWSSQLIIVLATSCAFAFAMFFGNVAVRFFHPVLANFIGAIILLFLGAWSLLEAFSRKSSNKREKTVVAFRIKSLGLVVKILREPTMADINTSGVIDTKEALLLGVALALDAFGAGFGAAAAGFGLGLTTILVSIASFVFLSIGLYIGRRKLVFLQKKSTKYLPGILLITLAIIRALQV